MPRTKYGAKIINFLLEIGNFDVEYWVYLTLFFVKDSNFGRITND